MTHDPQESPKRPRSTLFTVRVWMEPMQGDAEWRGKVHHLHSGEARYFRDWRMLVEFIEAIVARFGVGGGEEQ
jgi:hypothetical protein